MSDAAVLTECATRVEPWLLEIPVSAHAGMRVPARVFADRQLWDRIRSDRSLDQLVNVAMLPGVERAVYAMPDVHEGYGFPVGGVAAMRPEDGVISPGGVGYDINCGVRLLVSELDRAGLGDRLEPLVHDLSRSIPSGGYANPRLQLSSAELRQVLQRGSAALVERGLATTEDLACTEAGGSLTDAVPDAVSGRAVERGQDQLGTIGSGNHFVEVQVVETLYDPAAARVLGLRTGLVTVLIHTGSRGLGHQVCTDYVRAMQPVMARHHITLPDPQLACAPIRSPEGERYLGAMTAAANFAWANRQAITAAVREAFTRAFGAAGDLRLVYDVAHNLAKLEQHGGQRLWVHRKGATRAFGPSHPETPERYRPVGQPVFIPGSMGTASYVLAGTDLALERSFGSACHGAGRAMSRHAAKRVMPGHQVRRALQQMGVVVRCPSNAELAEEAPHAYKDVDRVVDVVEAAGLARRVARLRPVGVIKG
ncbi:MAG TPA: RtcB family protein [Gemmatimonadales bacterium]|nr:RtcB family protein [Gemmatimonadales bacterium]